MSVGTIRYTADTVVDVRGDDDAEAAEWVPVDEALATGLAFDHDLILRQALTITRS